jgi:A/G-specific adenine glycosylase
MNLSALISWSQTEFSQLPWRKNRSLYRTLVSEIMLQQTTVSTVKNHFDRFLVTFPDFRSLAEASEEELLVAWKGLGYYRRARSLKKIAQAIIDDHGGEIPADLDQLQLISGIGPYTANAILGIGLDQKALAVDANLERVISRLFGLKEEKGPKLQKEIHNLFTKGKIFHNIFSYRGLNEALMDLGRTFCQSRKASCDLCLLKFDCVAFKNGKPTSFPVDKMQTSKKSQEHELVLLRFYVKKANKLLVYKKEDHEWLAGQYEVPTFVISSTDERLKQYPELKNKFKYVALAQFKTGITKYKIQNIIITGEEKILKPLWDKRKLEWRSIEAANANFSTATLKGLGRL